MIIASAEKCARWRNPQKVEPGNYTVVLEPTAAADIVRLMAGAFNARNTDEGRTFLSKRGGGSLVGEKVFPEFVTLRSDPFDPRQPSSPLCSRRPTSNTNLANCSKRSTSRSRPSPPRR